MKMKRISAIILSLLLGLTLSAQSADSSKFVALGLKLEEYYDAMKHESLPVQEAECDFLIETATDSIVRQFIAQNIYDHYIGSPLMGAENVAVHVFDKWFADGTLSMSSPAAFADAKVHADFNRQSLIGRKAPEILLQAPDGSTMTLFGTAPDAAGPAPDSLGTASPAPSTLDARFSVLFFYDTGCPDCKLQTRLLNALFKAKKYPVRLYAIYVGDDRQGWMEYLSDEFRALPPYGFSDEPGVEAHHLWDPSLSSDFQRKYGVTGTPRLFLVAPDCTIIGRGLDAPALEIMLDGFFAPEEIVYGGRKSEELFDGIFALSAGRPSVGEVMGIADYIHDRTLQTGDTLMFKQLAGDYLYYLSTRYGEGFREGMKYHIDRNILGSDVWRSEDDSLKVVGFAEIMSDMLSKALPGTRVAAVKVPGELYTRKGGKSVLKRLDRLPGDENIIIFYTEGCDICAAEKAAALAMLASRKTVFMVNMDVLMTDNPSLANLLMDAFDLSSLPSILMTDRKGVVLRRYVSLSS